jgi:hypothetical protein
VLTAFSSSGAESSFSNEAVKFPPGKPSIQVTWSIPPPVLVSVLFEPVEPNTAAVDEYYFTVTGSGLVQIALAGTTCVDWIRTDGLPGGGGGTVVPTTPAIGANNNDGNTARTFTVTAPVPRSRADFDCTAFNGGTVTVQSVSKPLVKTGSSWGVNF